MLDFQYQRPCIELHIAVFIKNPPAPVLMDDCMQVRLHVPMNNPLIYCWPDER